MGKLDLDYYYGKESEQFTFYRLPKALITDSRFKDVTNNAKLLYGLMLDRMSLSRKRGWLDEENRVYIKYAIKSIAEDLNIAKNTGASLLKELQDVGLIDMIQQNGKANIIYVKNFISEIKEESKPIVPNDSQTVAKMEPVENKDQLNILTGAKTEPVENTNQSILSAGNPYEPDRFSGQIKVSMGTISNTEPVPAQKLSPNNILVNNNTSDNNHINLSSEMSYSGKMDKMDESTAYMNIIKENIDYDIMMSDKSWMDRGMYEDLYNIICDVVCVPRDTIRIGGEEYPYQLVKSKYLKLNSSHLQYVIGCLRNNTTKVNNIKAYLITALYNAPNTMDSYYNAEVNHDLYGVG
ncbi:MAG: replication initiator protein A [Lachnospiraceae bacterium]|nr:replication initiator protein A [Lachnospiraceae bacterium]